MNDAELAAVLLNLAREHLHRSDSRATILLKTILTLCPGTPAAADAKDLLRQHFPLSEHLLQ